jgi:sporulation protein YtfJ
VVAEHPIQGLMRTAMESIKEMVDVNTIVGDPVQTQDGQVIVPVSRVAFGFAAGGGDMAGGAGQSQGQGGGEEGDESGGGGEGGGQGRNPFAGGSGAGVSIQPMGFLVVSNRNVRMLSVDGRAVFDRLIDVAPQMIGELRGLFGGAGDGQGPAMEAGGVEGRPVGEAAEPTKRRQARDYRL